MVWLITINAAILVFSLPLTGHSLFSLFGPVQIKNSWTALIVASRGGFTEVVSILLEEQPNINAVDKVSITPSLFLSSCNFKSPHWLMVHQNSSRKLHLVKGQVASIPRKRVHLPCQLSVATFGDWVPARTSAEFYVRIFSQFSIISVMEPTANQASP